MSRNLDDNQIVRVALCTLDNYFREPAVIAHLTAKGIRVLTDVELLVELNKP